MHHRATDLSILLKRGLLGVLLGLGLAACAGPESQGEAEPERATGQTLRPMATGDRQMLVSANPHASRHGYRVLERGGTVIDAAIAVQATLTLVEPQSSGIGGGAFSRWLGDRRSGGSRAEDQINHQGADQQHRGQRSKRHRQAEGDLRHTAGAHARFAFFRFGRRQRC